MGCIYKITNNINGKIYIGQTTRTLRQRAYEHKKSSQNNLYLNKAFKKHGFENFSFDILYETDIKEVLNEMEIFFIQEHSSRDRAIGYNIEYGGRNSPISDETKIKMSKAGKGKKQTVGWVEKRIHGKGSEMAKKYGKPKSEEEKRILSESSSKYWLGKKRSKETKLKISETKRNGTPTLNSGTFEKRVIHLMELNGTLFRGFDSTKEASNYANVHQSTISRWCQKNKKINNKIWSYIE